MGCVEAALEDAAATAVAAEAGAAVHAAALQVVAAEEEEEDPLEATHAAVPETEMGNEAGWHPQDAM